MTQRITPTEMFGDDDTNSDETLFDDARHKLADVTRDLRAIQARHVVDASGPALAALTCVMADVTQALADINLGAKYLGATT